MYVCVCVFADLDDIGVGEARKALVFADDPSVFIVGAVTVPPAPGGTFSYTLLSPTTAQVVQPDSTCGGRDEGTEKLGEVELGEVAILYKSVREAFL